MLFFCFQQLSFSIRNQGASLDSQASPRICWKRSSAASRPTLYLLWEREVMRGVEMSLYWLLSKLTMDMSPGTEMPFFVRCVATRAAISSFLRLWKNKNDFADDQDAKYWLIRVAINEGRRSIVSKWNKYENLDDYAEKLSFQTTEMSDLFYSVMNLPRKYRIVMLNALKGLLSRNARLLSSNNYQQEHLMIRKCSRTQGYP